MPVDTGRYIDFVAISNLFEIGWQMSKIRGANIENLEPISPRRGSECSKMCTGFAHRVSHQEAV
jgi:hypothetical protein